MFMCESRKFCQSGSNSSTDVVFLVDEGREDPNTTWPTSEASFKWHFAGGPMVAQH